MTIKELRFKKDITQYQLAKATGISQSAIWQIENHIYSASDEKKELISKALGVKTEEIDWNE